MCGNTLGPGQSAAPLESMWRETQSDEKGSVGEQPTQAACASTTSSSRRTAPTRTRASREQDSSSLKRARDVGGGYNDGQKQGLKVVKKGEPGSHEIVSHENEPASDLFPCTSTANAFVAHEDESGLDWVLQHLAGDAGQEEGDLGEVTSVGESSTFKHRQGPATTRKRVNEGLGEEVIKFHGAGHSFSHKDGAVTVICLTKKSHPMTMESATGVTFSLSK